MPDLIGGRFGRIAREAGEDEAFGGAQIYRLAIEAGVVNAMYLTHVERYEGDTFFPEFARRIGKAQPLFRHVADERNEAPFTVQRYDACPCEGRMIGRVFAAFLIVLVRGYQVLISPCAGQQLPPQPACSAYMIEALREWESVDRRMDGGETHCASATVGYTRGTIPFAPTQEG